MVPVRLQVMKRVQVQMRVMVPVMVILKAAVSQYSIIVVQLMVVAMVELVHGVAELVMLVL